MTALFADQWLWLIFICVGLLLALAELLGGIDTGLELVAVGSAFALGGLIGWAFDSWPATVVAFGVLCIAYVAVGRRYLKRWAQVRETKTNVDALIGRTGLVVKGISKYERGRVQVNGRLWRASAEEDVEAGAEVTITAIRGSTLIVYVNGGDQQ